MAAANVLIERPERRPAAAIRGLDARACVSMKIHYPGSIGADRIIFETNDLSPNPLGPMDSGPHGRHPMLLDRDSYIGARAFLRCFA